MVMTPLRDIAVGLAATVYPTVPLPAPDVPELSVIQATLLDAVQVHPVVAVTPTVLDEPAAAARAVVVESV